MALRPFPWLVLSFFGFWFFEGMYTPFFPDYLNFKSISPTTIGTLMSSAFIFRFLGSVFFTRLIKDANQLLPNLRFVAWASCLAMLALSFSIDNFYLLYLCLWGFSFVNGACIPLSDTLATTWGKQVKLDYGRVRLIGAFAFASGTLIFGEIIGLIGKEYTLWLLVAVLALYGLLQMFPTAITPQHQLAENTSTNPPKVWEILKDPIILRVLGSVALVQGAHACYYIFCVIYWQSIGLEISQTSIIMGISTLCEVVFFFWVSKLFGKWKVRNLFYISALVSALRWGLFTTPQGFIWILLLQCLHCVTFSLSHYAMMRFISSYPANYTATLQGLYNAIANSASIALMSLLAGWLYPFSPSYAFGAMAIFAIFAVVLTPRKLTYSTVEAL